MAIDIATTRQALADTYKGLATSGVSNTAWVALHTAKPTTVGQFEITGGSPAYARKQITWTSGTGGTLTAANVTFDVPASTTATHASLCSASTAGAMVDVQVLTPSIGIGAGANGTITITATFTLT